MALSKSDRDFLTCLLTPEDPEVRYDWESLCDPND